MLRTLNLPLMVTIAAGFTPLERAEAASFQIQDFRDQSSLIRTHAAAQQIDGVLRLTPDQGSQAGSAFFNSPLSSDSSWSTFFSFRIHGERATTGDGADGLTFVIHNDPRGETALGRDGSGLGYGDQGLFFGPPIQNSLAVAFDTFPYQAQGLGNISILENGSNSPKISEILPFDLADGVLRNAWIEYDSKSSFLSVFLSGEATKPTVPLIRYSVDQNSLLGGQFWAGFTASTGARFNIHDIEQWSFSLHDDFSQSIPESSFTLGLAMVGTLFFGCLIKQTITS